MNNYIERVVALVLLVFLMPIISIAGILVYLEDKKSIIYKQERVGKNGKLFKIYKLRTMIVNNDNSLSSGPNDHRITSVGKILRKLKIDELLQLINVAKGEMSFVGYRPEIPSLFDNYNEVAKLDLKKLTPGITDPASLYYCNEEYQLSRQTNPKAYYLSNIVPHKVSLSLIYSKKQTFYNDGLILLLTIVHPLLGQKKVLTIIDKILK